MTATEQLSAGAAALERGDWIAASAAFEAALRDAPSAEALDGLGQARWWLNDLDRAIELRADAYARFLSAGRPAPAIRIAAWLAREHFTVHGDLAVAGGWISRAASLAEKAGDCAEVGWLALMQSALAGDPEQMKQLAERAIGLGRSLPDSDLEVVGLSAKGLAHVYAAEVDEGMALLDEAMAAATGGEVKSFWAFSDVYCNTLLACDRAGDFERAEQWCRVVMEMCQRKATKPLFPFCHVTYGAILVATGRWPEAEEEFTLALRLFDVGHRGMRVVALARLAELRLRQGRIEEAAVLLEGYEEHPLAIRAAVRLLLATGRPSLAAGLLHRRLDLVGSGSALAAPLLALLAEAQLAIGNVTAATATAADLAALAARSGQRSLRAEAEMWQGAAAAAHGDGALGRRHLERAMDLYREVELPLEEARARVRVAELVADEDAEFATAYLNAALAVFERLGARPDADAAAGRLRELGRAPLARPRAAGTLTVREEQVLELVADGLTNAEIGRRLFISPKTAEHHVGAVLRKLGLRTRAEAAAYLARRPATK
jgi:DNA-binding CsgD family transcriptional regulator